MFIIEGTVQAFNTAVQQDWSAPQYVRDQRRSKELHLAAVQQDWRALQFVPEV